MQPQKPSNLTLLRLLCWTVSLAQLGLLGSFVDKRGKMSGEGPSDGEDRCGGEDCGLPISGPGPGVIQCSLRVSCRRLFHVGCAGLAPSDFAKMQRHSKQKAWTCSDCGGEELDQRPQPNPELPLCAICCRNLLPSDEGDVLHCPSCALPSHRKCSDIKDAAWRKVTPESLPSCRRCLALAAREPGSEAARHFSLFWKALSGPKASLPAGWTVTQTNTDTPLSIHAMKLSCAPEGQVFVSRSIQVDGDGRLRLFAHGFRVPEGWGFTGEREVLSLAVARDALGELSSIARFLDRVDMCPGIFEERILSLARDGILDGFLLDSSGYQLCNLSIPVKAPLSEQQVKVSIRSKKCRVLIDNAKMARRQGICAECGLLSRNLARKIVPEQSQDEFSRLRRAALERKVRSLDSKLKLSQQTEKEQRKEIQRRIRKEGQPVDAKMEQWLMDAALDASSEERASKLSPLAALFLREQVKAAQTAGPSGRRWHPLTIQHCLAMHSRSPSAYNELSHVLTLPTARTLYEYSHAQTYEGGVQPDLFDRVVGEYKGRCDSMEQQQYIALVMDSLSLKEGLATNPRTGNVFGFSRVESLDQQLEELESGDPSLEGRQRATELFCVMLRSLTFKFDRILAAWPCHAPTGSNIYSFVWRLIEVLQACGLTVVCVIADGASSNGKFFDLSGRGPVPGRPFSHKTPNPFRRDHSVWFLYDPVHTMKVMRNNLSNSGSHRNTRQMRLGGKDVRWDHVAAVWEAESHANVRVTKLSDAHVHLNAYSCMKVGLAATTMSQSVADRMHSVGEQSFGPGNCPYCSTEQYIRTTDVLFDLGNIRSVDKEAQTKRKPISEPFRSSSDERLQIFAQTARFFDDWRNEVAESPGGWPQYISQTLDRMIQTNCRTFPELISWLLDSAGFAYVLTARLNQDPLESAFADLRSFHGGMRNPTAGPALSSIPVVAAGKAAQAAFKGSTNVDPSLAAEQSGAAEWAARVADPPRLETRKAAAAARSEEASTATARFGLKVIHQETSPVPLLDPAIEARLKDLEQRRKTTGTPLYYAELLFTGHASFQLIKTLDGSVVASVDRQSFHRFTKTRQRDRIFVLTFKQDDLYRYVVLKLDDKADIARCMDQMKRFAAS